MSVVYASEGSLGARPDGSADLEGLPHLERKLSECWLMEDDLGWSDRGRSGSAPYVSSPVTG